LGNRIILGVFYISYSIADDQRHNNRLVLHCFLFTMTLKGVEPAPDRQ